MMNWIVRKNRNKRTEKSFKEEELELSSGREVDFIKAEKKKQIVIRY